MTDLQIEELENYFKPKGGNIPPIHLSNGLIIMRMKCMSMLLSLGEKLYLQRR